jgi:hypothetical protein
VLQHHAEPGVSARLVKRQATHPNLSTNDLSSGLRTTTELCSRISENCVASISLALVADTGFVPRREHRPIRSPQNPSDSRVNTESTTVVLTFTIDEVHDLAQVVNILMLVAASAATTVVNSTAEGTACLRSRYRRTPCVSDADKIFLFFPCNGGQPMSVRLWSVDCSSEHDDAYLGLIGSEEGS